MLSSSNALSSSANAADAMPLDELLLITRKNKLAGRRPSHLKFKLATRVNAAATLVESTLLGTTPGHYVLFSVLFIALLFAGQIAWQWGSYGGNEFFDDTFQSSWWFSFTHYINVGPQYSFHGQYEDNKLKVVAIAFSLLGYVYNTAFCAIIVSHVRYALNRLFLRYSQLFVRDHVLILGWTSKTMFLVEQLITMFEDGNNGRGEIVIVGNRSEYEMRRAIELNFRRRQPPKPWTVRIRVWEGEVSEEDNLLRVSLASARFVICLGESENPRVADSQVSETLLSIQALAAEEQPRGSLIAEVRTVDSRAVLGELNSQVGMRVLSVSSAAVADKVMAACALAPALGKACIDLLSFQGSNLTFVEVDVRLVGGTFAAARLGYPQCIVCGVHTTLPNRQSEIILAPPADRTILANDRLLVVCMDRKSATMSGQPDSAGPLGLLAPHRTQPSHVRVVKSAAAFEGGAPREHLERTLGLAPGGEPRPREARPEVVLILGWRSAREMVRLVSELSALLAPGSELHILSSTDKTAREEVFGRESVSARLSESAMRTVSAAAAAAGVHMFGGFAVTQHVGTPTSLGALDTLPLARATVAIVLADPTVGATAEELESFSESNTRMRDGSIFQIATLLRKLSGTHQTHLRIVPVYDGILAGRIMARKGILVSANDPLTSAMHRNEVETGLIAMQANDPTLVVVVSKLFAGSAHARAIFTLPVREALPQIGMHELTLGALSFNAMANAAFQTSGYVLLGWFDPVSNVCVVNPEERDVDRRWYATEELVFLRATKSSSLSHIH